MKYIGAIIIGLISFLLILVLYYVIKSLIIIPWLFNSTILVIVIAIWNALINARAFLWIYYDFKNYDAIKNKQGISEIQFDKYFRIIEQVRHFIFNFLGMMIGWISLFVFIYRTTNFAQNMGLVDLGLVLLMLLGISGNLPWISTKVTKIV